MPEMDEDDLRRLAERQKGITPAEFESRRRAITMGLEKMHSQNYVSREDMPPIEELIALGEKMIDAGDDWKRVCGEIRRRCGVNERDFAGMKSKQCADCRAACCWILFARIKMEPQQIRYELKLSEETANRAINRAAATMNLPGVSNVSKTKQQLIDAKMVEWIVEQIAAYYMVEPAELVNRMQTRLTEIRCVAAYFLRQSGLNDRQIAPAIGLVSREKVSESIADIERRIQIDQDLRNQIISIKQQVINAKAGTGKVGRSDTDNGVQSGQHVGKPVVHSVHEKDRVEQRGSRDRGSAVRNHKASNHRRRQHRQARIDSVLPSDAESADHRVRRRKKDRP